MSKLFDYHRWIDQYSLIEEMSYYQYMSEEEVLENVKK